RTAAAERGGDSARTLRGARRGGLAGHSAGRDPRVRTQCPCARDDDRTAARGPGNGEAHPHGRQARLPTRHAGGRMTRPALVCCSHGTDSPEGRAVISAIVDDARVLVGTPTYETYVDVQYPQIDE